MITVVVIIFVFFIILSLLYLLGWLYNPDNSILGGAILMLLALMILLVLFILSERSRQQKNKTGAEVFDRFSVSTQAVICRSENHSS